MSNFKVTLNYKELACILMALKNNAERTIEVCDNLINLFDKAAIEGEPDGRQEANGK